MNRAAPGARVLALNTVWTLAGLVLPGIIGLVALPEIVHGYGDERFAVLSFTWMIIGYFSLFDLGLGRAVTNRVAALIGARQEERLAETVWTAWLLALVVGTIGGILAALAVPPLIDHVVKVSPSLRAETVEVFYLLCAGVPMIATIAAIRGVLEASQRFGMVNAVRIPTGVLTFVIPLVGLHYTKSVVPVTVGLIVMRIAGAAAYATMCLRSFPELRRPARPSRDAARTLFSFGAWMTVSNIVSPLMVSADRFFISAVITVAAVTYYVTPLEAVSKILLVPSAIAAVLFPAFSASGALDRDRMSRLFRHALRALALIEAPIAFVLICFAPQVLRLWLGEPFAVNSASVMRWLMVGVVFNSVGQIGFSLLQGLGRSDLTARLHLIEAPLYAGLLWVLLHSYGITGAAAAWCTRTAFDAIALQWLATRESRIPWRTLLPGGLAPLALMVPVIASMFVTGLVAQLSLTAAFGVVYVVALWTWGIRGIVGARAMLTLAGVRSANAP